MDTNSGRLVWAKLKHCWYWPAKIVEAPPELGKIPCNKMCVLFFGTKNFGFVPTENIMDYESHRAKYIKKGRGVNFREAVKQMDDFIRDPITFASNAVVKPINRTLTVKKERDMATIKNEKDLDESPFISNEVQILDVGSKIDQLNQEKADIIQELVNIKAENQNMNFAFQQKADEMQTLIERHLAEKTQFNRTIQGLQDELVEWKRKCSIEIEKYNKIEKTISGLKREKNELSAHLMQLRRSIQTPIQQNKSEASKPSTDTEDEVYEVEALLRHKTSKKVRSFLVRWEGYSPEYDTWVPECDLHCEQLLTAYLKENNLK